MRRILIGLVILLPLLSLANAGILDSLTCPTLHIGCATALTNSIAINATNSTSSTPSANTTIATNASAGSVSLLASGSGQYNYQILLPKSLTNGSSIFTFYLLGRYNNSLGFQYPAKVTCNTTTQINCTAIFIVTVGSYSKLEVIRNSIWQYALALPQNITTKYVQPVTIVPQQVHHNALYVLYAFGIIGIVLVTGNIGYDRYRIWKNPNAYNEVNA